MTVFSWKKSITGTKKMHVDILLNCQFLLHGGSRDNPQTPPSYPPTSIHTGTVQTRARPVFCPDFDQVGRGRFSSTRGDLQCWCSQHKSKAYVLKGVVWHFASVRTPDWVIRSITALWWVSPNYQRRNKGLNYIFIYIKKNKLKFAFCNQWLHYMLKLSKLKRPQNSADKTS